MNPATPNAVVINDDAPPVRLSVLTWMRSQFFSTPLNALLTILSVWLLLATIPALVEWAFVKANVSATTAQECRGTGGACWAFIYEKHRLILFGLYPYDEQWRPLIATCILLGVIVLSGFRYFWNLSLVVIWTVALIAVAVLM